MNYVAPPAVLQEKTTPHFHWDGIRPILSRPGVHPVERVVWREISSGADGGAPAGDDACPAELPHGKIGPPQAAGPPVRARYGDIATHRLFRKLSSLVLLYMLSNTYVLLLSSSSQAARVRCKNRSRARFSLVELHDTKKNGCYVYRSM